MLLLAALTLFANSCTTTDKPLPVNTPTDSSPLVPDAAAAMEGFLAFGEFAVTPVSGFAVGVLVAVLAANESGLFGRQTNAVYSFGKINNVALPIFKEMSNNPFEQIGKMHNIGLDYINKRGDFNEWRNRFINYDAAAWEEMMDIVSPGMANVDKVQMLNTAKQARIIERIQTVITQVNVANQHGAITNSSLSPSGQAYVNAFVNAIKAMIASGKSLSEVADYVNLEIAARLNIENIYSTEESAILTFLTVAKHSGFYWHN